MRIYLAARYSRRKELLGYRAILQALGHVVTSRWLNGDHQITKDGVPIGEHGEALVEGAGADERAAALRLAFATEDVFDVLSADCVISFTEPPRQMSASRGGRHVEFGIGIAINELASTGAVHDPMRLIVVGYRENIFHWRRDVEFFPTWQACAVALCGEVENAMLRAALMQQLNTGGATHAS